MFRLKCPHCTRVWFYKGSGKYDYTTCVRCKGYIRVKESVTTDPITPKLKPGWKARQIFLKPCVYVLNNGLPCRSAIITVQDKKTNKSLCPTHRKYLEDRRRKNENRRAEALVVVRY